MNVPRDENNEYRHYLPMSNFQFVCILSSWLKISLYHRDHFYHTHQSHNVSSVIQSHSLYNALFSQLEVSAAQVLLTESDFRDENHLTSLKYSIDRLVSVGIIPIINENDAVSAFSTTTNVDAFTDNDSLAALCARSFGCDMCILLTDVDGVFDRPPNQEGAKLLPFYSQDQSVGIGEKSKHGRGGMASKIEAAQFAVSPGSQCRACVVVSGNDLSAIRALANSEYELEDGEEPKGTLFVTPGSELEEQALEDIKFIEVSSDHLEDDGHNIIGCRTYLSLTCQSFHMF